MSDPFAQFAVLAAEPPKTTIPEELLVGLEMATKRGPLGTYERRPIGSVPLATADDIIDMLNEGLHPYNLHVQGEPIEQADGRLTLAVRRWTPGG